MLNLKIGVVTVLKKLKYRKISKIQFFFIFNFILLIGMIGPKIDEKKIFFYEKMRKNKPQKIRLMHASKICFLKKLHFFIFF